MSAASPDWAEVGSIKDIDEHIVAAIWSLPLEKKPGARLATSSPNTDENERLLSWPIDLLQVLVSSATKEQRRPNGELVAPSKNSQFSIVAGDLAKQRAARTQMATVRNE